MASQELKLLKGEYAGDDGKFHALVEVDGESREIPAEGCEWGLLGLVEEDGLLKYKFEWCLE